MTWDKFTKKLRQKIENPKFAGYFPLEQTIPDEIRRVEGKIGDLHEGCAIAFYLLVDETDGIIADIRYQVFGPPALLGAAEIACELMIRKNYDQVSRISAELIDRHVQDLSGKEAFPEKNYPHLNLIILAIDEAAQKCTDIPFASSYETTPIFYQEDGISSPPNWDSLSKQEKLLFIEEVIKKEVRPYIELDAGGIEILDLQDLLLTISYQGSCTSCYAATGSTLQAIQGILRAKVHPQILVTPKI